MDFSLQSGNQISLKRDDKPSFFRVLFLKPNDELDFFNIAMVALSGVMLIIGLGLYFYNESLATKVAEKKAEVDGLQKNLTLTQTKELKRLNAQLKYVNQFTSNYTYMNTAFVILGKSIENSVVYNGVKLNKESSGDFNVKLSGNADSYKTLAQQMNTLNSPEQKKYFVDLKLNSFGLDKVSGKISFDITTKLNFTGILPDSDKLQGIGSLENNNSVPSATPKATAPVDNPTP